MNKNIELEDYNLDNIIEIVPSEYKFLIKKGILVIPINIFFTKYEELKNSIYDNIFSNIKNSDNTLHVHTSNVPFSYEDINLLNDILWNIIKEYYQLLNIKKPSYYSGFSIIYNKEYEKKLNTHIDDSLYTINMCIRNNNIEGSEIIFHGSSYNYYSKVYSPKKIFVNCKEDYMIIHLGNHTHQTNELIDGERVNIILWYK